jgi:D-alanyl-D-alanine-carboxypeptidase/D-alanyl-D-alanine-endopeptidase
MGNALAKAGNSSFADLLKSRVFEAASMADTTTALTDEQKKRTMVGLDPFNKKDPKNIVPDIMYASAGVYSTVDAMASQSNRCNNGSTYTRTYNVATL